MTGRVFWKLFFSACVLAWSAYYLIPFRDTPYATYLNAHATADLNNFQKILDQAQKQVAEASADQVQVEADKAKAEATGQTYLPDVEKNDFIQRHRTLFLALRSIGEDDNVDFLRFYPDLKIADIKNIPRRNEIILNYLLSSSKARLKYGLDLEGGVGFTLSLDDKALAQATEQQRTQSMQKVIDIMSRRINGLGVSEPVIRPRGDNSVEIQLPGVTTKDNPEAIDLLKKPAKLEFRMVYRGDPATTPPDQFPLGYEVLQEERENPQTGALEEYPHFVSIRPSALGNIVSNAYPQMDQSGRILIALRMTSDGGKVFEDMTQQIEDENNKPKYADLPELEDNSNFKYGQLAIVLDGKLYSAPMVKKAIPGGQAVIEGSFTAREATELANVLNNPLEHELRLDEMYEIGPSLAAEARSSSVRAAILGSALVVVFMLVMYALAGFLSIITLAMHLVVIIGIQSSIGATLTLPGVAALVLTVGMAVDANILIYERMREEMGAGKSLWHSLEAGYDRALASIIDSNFTTLITALILIWLGTGPIKGFGVILAIGLVSNLFCVLVFNQALLELVIGSNWVTKLHFLRLIPETKLPFFSYRKIAIGISILVIVVGMGAVAARGSKALGTDFRGGEEVSLKFAQSIPIGEIEQVAKANGDGDIVAAYQTELGTGEQQLKIQTESGVGKKLFADLSKAHPDSKLELLGINIIGATVSQGLKWNALEAVALSLLAVMVYVAFRFEIGYAVGAIVATIHDVLVTVGVFVLLGGQFTAPMVAAVLMIIGYSLNDTVIVFDRVREELKLNPSLKLVQVLDLAVNKTLARTTLTSLTTFLAATSLFVFGAGVVSDFALVFMIGIITGTASSIFIANPVFYWWHKGDRNHVESHEFLPKYEWEASTRASR